MASSSAPKHDDFGEEDLKILKNLCRQLRSTSFKDILDESRISQKETLPLQRPITPPSSKISDQNNEFPECLLNPRSHDYSQIPLFQREKSNRTFKSEFSTQIPINQSCIRNRAPISSSNFASKEIRKTEQQKHKEDNMAELNLGRMRGSRVRPVDKFEEEEGLGFKEERDKRASRVRRPISIKGKMKEVLSDSDSDSGSSYESVSSSSTGSFQKPKVFAKRPDSFRKLRKSPSKIFRKSRSPINQQKLPKSPSNHLSKSASRKNDVKAHSKVPIHDNKTPNKIPSLKMNKDKVFVKMPSLHNKKHLNKMPSHHNESGPSNIKDASKKSKEKSGFKKKKQKDKLKSSEKESIVKKSGFKKLKDKFVHVLHHHHHRHHEEIVPAQHHRSPWKFVKDVVHKPSDWVAEIVTHQHPHLRRLVDHFHLNWKKKKKSKDGRNEKKKKNKGRKKKNKKVHWWSKWRKGGVKMSNGKKKKGGRVKMGWKKGFGKKKVGKF